jgi:hypothetical protein
LLLADLAFEGRGVEEHVKAVQDLRDAVILDHMH